MIPNLSNQHLLTAILGGIFVDVGVGIIVRQNLSASGDDALVLAIHKITGLKIAHCYLYTDLTVILLSLSYIPLQQVLFSILTSHYFF